MNESNLLNLDTSTDLNLTERETENHVFDNLSEIETQELPLSVRFGLILRFFRTQKRMSQQQLAQMLGIKAYSTISRWENGFVYPKKMIPTLAEIFEVPADVLRTGIPIIDKDNNVLKVLTSSFQEVPPPVAQNMFEVFEESEKAMTQKSFTNQQNTTSCNVQTKDSDLRKIQIYVNTAMETMSASELNQLKGFVAALMMNNNE